MTDAAEKLDDDGSPASSSTKSSYLRSTLRDLVLTPWPGGWAVLRVGGKRPGRVRASREEALRLALGIARDGKVRLYVADHQVDLDALNARLAAGLEDVGETVGVLALDARNPPSRAERDRWAKIEAVATMLAKGRR